MPSIAVVSDSHISMANPDAGRNWDAVIEHLTVTRPDLVIHAGDVTARGLDSSVDLGHARSQLDRLPVPWLVVPGNHDVGVPDVAWRVTTRRRARFEAAFGPRFWVSEQGDWRIVGLDTEALASGHLDDEASWAWTADQLSTDRPTVVVMHRPLAPLADDEADADRRYLAEPGRTRLRRLLDEAPVEIVVSGHLHQWRNLVSGSIRWIWAPSTWAAIDPTVQPVIGEKTVGLVELDLAAPEQARLVRPAGIEHHLTSRALQAEQAKRLLASSP